MSDPSTKPWSNSLNAPQITPLHYRWEKAITCGVFITAILYGITIVLFYRCMAALLSPLNRRKGIKWGLVAHTVAMFLFLTIDVCTNLDLQSISYVDNREFSGVSAIGPGPFAYQQDYLSSDPINTVPETVFLFNMWLADGLLLYRCHIIYSMNCWVTAFPFLLYLASIASSIVILVQDIHPTDSILKSVIPFDYVCYPISLSLTLLLTLMVILRLAWHGRNMRNAVGSGTNGSGIYDAVVATLVESYALYALSFMVYIPLLDTGNPMQLVLSPIFVEAQVIAPYLVVLRVANRKALTSNSFASGNVGSIRFRSQGGSSDGNGTIPNGDPMNSTEMNGSTLDERGPRAESTIEEVPW